MLLVARIGGASATGAFKRWLAKSNQIAACAPLLYCPTLLPLQIRLLTKPAGLLGCRCGSIDMQCTRKVNNSNPTGAVLT